MRFAKYPRQTSMKRVRLSLVGDSNRKIWAVTHKQGTSLIKAHHGAQAIHRARILLGDSLGPFVVPRGQDQLIAIARIEGAEVLSI